MTHSFGCSGYKKGLSAIVSTMEIIDITERLKGVIIYPDLML
ncbi:TSCPD domain-containing protein [Larsenimonas rhizosphaerae]